MIEVRAHKRLADFTLDVDFAVPARGITALFGRSGSGKTSIIRAIAGAVQPDNGRIAVRDRVFFDSSAGIDMALHQRRIGYIFQDSRLFPHLSVRGNLTYGYKRARVARKFDLDAIVALLGLSPLIDRRTHHLSGGERQRVAIGRALLAQPELLLMDEPLSSLDPQRKSELLPYIESLRDELELPILYISHAFDEVLRLAEHLVVIDGGRAVRSGPLLDLASDPSLSPLIGRFEAGSVIECTIVCHDPQLALSTLACAGGPLRVPIVEAAVGDRLRVRIRSRDVSIALSRPTDVSITNHLPGRIDALVDKDGPYAEASIDIGGATLRALITRESVARLALAPGQQVWALVKTVSFDGRSLGVMRSRHPASGDGP